MTVTVSLTASMTSLAVPSPPANIRTSMPASLSALAASTVSSGLVICPGSYTTIMWSIRFFRTSSPISPPAVRNSYASRSPAALSASAARLDAMGTAPRLSASSSTSVESVPLRPTEPPMPAMGLISKPTFINDG